MARARRIFDRQRSEFDRGLSFFDAIYGFAITLLIANLDIPPAEAWQSLDTLLAGGLGTQLVGFVISFIVIAAFWARNAALTAEFSGLDGAVITANLVTAGFVVMLPFTTQGISDPELDRLPLPTVLYAANVALALAALLATREIGRVRGLVDQHATRRARWAHRVDAAAQILIFLVSIPVTLFVGPDWGKTVWLALIVVGPVLGNWSSRVIADEGESVSDSST